MIIYLSEGSKGSQTCNDKCSSTQNIKMVYSFSDLEVMFWVVSIQGFVQD